MAKPPLTRPGPSRPRAREDAFPASQEFSLPEPESLLGNCRELPAPGLQWGVSLRGRNGAAPPLRGCSAVAEGGGDGVPPAGSA